MRSKMLDKLNAFFLLLPEFDMPISTSSDQEITSAAHNVLARQHMEKAEAISKDLFWYQCMDKNES